MANYYGKSPLRMECPHCGTCDEHPVTRTDPDSYNWAQLAPLFERTVGRDLWYRRRTKRCKFCDVEFQTAELADVFLRALINETSRLGAETQRAANDIESLKLELTKFRQAANEAIQALETVQGKRAEPPRTRKKG